MTPELNENSPLDAEEFYQQIEAADDKLDRLSTALWDAGRAAEDLSVYTFEQLADMAEKIEDEERHDKFSTFFYLSEVLDEITDKCLDLSKKIDTLREYNLSELVCEAEEMAEEIKKSSLINAEIKEHKNKN